MQNQLRHLHEPLSEKIAQRKQSTKNSASERERRIWDGAYHSILKPVVFAFHSTWTEFKKNKTPPVKALS